MTAAAARDPGLARHPPIGDVRDLLTFRMAMIAAANDRIGQGWLKADYGLRLIEWRVLALVAAMQPVRFNQVARALLVDKGQLSRIVRRLVSRGLVVASPDDDDLRTVLLSLTDDGAVVHRAALATALVRNDLVLSALTDEEATMLFHLLDKLQPYMDRRVDEAGKGRGLRQNRQSKGGRP